MKKLYIFNGLAMLSHFNSHKPDENKIYTSFNEAMCQGKAESIIFSDGFIETRSQSLNTTADEYRKVVTDNLKPLFSNKESELTLWFDYDMFCQINLLTLLAYLDQTERWQAVKINLVDYNHEIQESVLVSPKGYYEIYKTVLLEKRTPQHIELSSMRTGIDLYLQLENSDNEIFRYIKEHGNEPKQDLVKLLLKNFRQYGLGDTQYIELIDRTRS